MIKALSVKHIRYNVLKLIDILLNKKEGALWTYLKAIN